MVYSTGRFVLCLTLCHFVLVFFSPFSIAITSLGEVRAGLSAFRMFFSICACLVLSVSFSCCVWDGLRLVIVALHGLLSYLFCDVCAAHSLFFMGPCGCSLRVLSCLLCYCCL